MDVPHDACLFLSSRPRTELSAADYITGCGRGPIDQCEEHSPPLGRINASGIKLRGIMCNLIKTYTPLGRINASGIE